MEEWNQKEGKSPHISQLAEITGLSADRIGEANQAADVLRNMTELSETEAETSPQLWDDGEDRTVDRMDLARVLNLLEPEQRKIIILRYYRDCTQQQTADALGISQVQVCRIEKRTLKLMAEKMAE